MGLTYTSDPNTAARALPARDENDAIFGCVNAEINALRATIAAQAETIARLRGMLARVVAATYDREDFAICPSCRTTISHCYCNASDARALLAVTAPKVDR